MSPLVPRGNEIPREWKILSNWRRFFVGEPFLLAFLDPGLLVPLGVWESSYVVDDFSSSFLMTGIYDVIASRLEDNVVSRSEQRTVVVAQESKVPDLQSESVSLFSRSPSQNRWSDFSCFIFSIRVKFHISGVILSSWESNLESLVRF